MGYSYSSDGKMKQLGSVCPKACSRLVQSELLADWRTVKRTQGRSLPACELRTGEMAGTVKASVKLEDVKFEAENQ